MGKKFACILVILMTIISCSVMLSYNSIDGLKKFSTKAIEAVNTSLNNMALKITEQMSKLLEHNKIQNSAKDVDRQVPVFKTEYRVLNKQLSNKDKDGILSVARKLSPVDYERINKYLGSEEDQQIIRAVKLLRDRLTSKEYQSVEKIMKEYISEESLRVELEKR